MARLLQRRFRHPLALSMLCAVLSLVTPTAVHARSFIEGYVFNTHTGVPLQGAEVILGLPILPLPVVSRPRELRTFTDGNGFYSFRGVTTKYETVTISSICVTPKGTAISGQARLVRLREGTIRRDLSIDAARGLSFSQCTVTVLPK